MPIGNFGIIPRPHRLDLSREQVVERLFQAIIESVPTLEGQLRVTVAPTPTSTLPDYPHVLPKRKRGRPSSTNQPWEHLRQMLPDSDDDDADEIEVVEEIDTIEELSTSYSPVIIIEI